MSTAANRAREIVLGAIAAVNEELPPERRVDASDETALVGPEAALDSLRLINLVVHVEDRIERELGVQVSLTDSEDLFAAEGPLATAGRFIDHLARLIEDKAA